MSALLGLPIMWQPDDYIYFKKCGEITISPDIQNIGFNCLFCAGICLQSEVFLQHLQEQHKEEVFKLYEQQNINSNNNSTNEILINLTTDITNSPNTEISVNKENSLIFNNFPNAEEISPRPLSDLNLMYDLENNDLLTLNYTTNQDFENLITLNPLENLTNNTLTINSPLTSNETPTINTPTSSNVVVASVDYFKNCLPDDNECEIGDGEDSGIILVQSPCNSDCAGFSDCMSFTEDSCSKSPKTLNEDCQSPNPEFSKNLVETKSTINSNQEIIKSAKQKYLKTPAMSKALDNKPLIEYLIETYRKNEKLWNPQHPSYKYNAHRNIFNELSQPLLNDMKYSLTGEEIFGIINQLRGRYRRELKKFEMRKGKHKTRLWYFDKMAFLRPIIEEKRKERVNKEKEEDTVKETDLTQRQMLSFLLELYRRKECLWDIKNSDYLLCNKEEIFEEIAEELKEKLNVNLKANECINEIQKLRIRYRKELRVLHKLKGLYIPKLWCFDEMEFLREQMEEKINKNLKKSTNHTISTLSKRKHDFLKASEIKFENLDEQLKFIEIYQSFNSLWDVDHPDYRSTNYRRKALNEMLEKLNSLKGKDLKYKLPQLEKTIYLLRKNFSQEKLKHLKDTNKTETSSMSLILYEKLSQFLINHVGPFRCDSCQHLSKTYDQFKMHKSKHDGTQPFICSLCGKGFQIPGNLTIHIRRHRRDFPYACEICKKSFATSTEVSIHMRSHTGERPYVCEWCDKTFKTWSFCDLHRRTHLNQSNFLCPICDKTFYERNRFTDHMNVHLNIRKHQCDQCVKSFTTLGNLKKHLNLMHASGKVYKC